MDVHGFVLLKFETDAAAHDGIGRTHHRHAGIDGSHDSPLPKPALSFREAAYGRSYGR
jgi:hypothetical protein